MSTQILIKRSTTTGAIPTAQDIAVGELAINTVDKRIFTNNSGTIVELGTTPTTQAVTGNASVGGTFDVVGAVTVGNFSADGTVDLTSATVTIPAPTADTHPATKKYVDDEVNAILDGAPAALDTLNEIAAAINDDANVFTTLTNSIATKLPLAGGTMTGAIDMGVNGITTSVDPATANTLTRKSYVDGLYQSTVDAEDSATAAAASATAAANSAASAASSASTATTQASNASTSATNAATSATNAGNSATSSANSATASATSATQSASSASAASTSETNAATSATNAATSATEAQTIVDSLGDVVLSTGDTMTGNLNFGDNDKAVFGAGSDLQIYHDGSRSIIYDGGTGELSIRANGPYAEIMNGGATETMARFNNNSSVDLFYDNSKKLATTSTGVDITGTATMDGLTVDGIVNIADASEAKLSLVRTGARRYDVTVDGSANFAIADNAFGDRFNISSGGDISFYEDTGTTAKFFWDASAESLGIGTSSPTAKLTIDDGAIRSLVSRTFNLFGSTGTASNPAYVTYSFADDYDTGMYSTGANTLNFATGASERMRIDSSGNLLVGQTSSFAPASSNVAGFAVGYSGYISASRSENPSAEFGRITSDGDIAVFRKDGSVVGSIGVDNSDNLYIQGDSTETGLQFGTSEILPHQAGAIVDNVVNIGSSGVGFKDLYLSGGVYLGGTGSANKLDDYEEGTFTVTTNGDATGTFISEDAEYTKVGRLVTVEIVFNIGVSFTSTKIGGLPFTVGDLVTLTSIGQSTTVLCETKASDPIHAAAIEGTSTIIFYAGDSLTAHAPSSTQNIYRIQLSYMAA